MAGHIISWPQASDWPEACFTGQELRFSAPLFLAFHFASQKSHNPNVFPKTLLTFFFFLNIIFLFLFFLKTVNREKVFIYLFIYLWLCWVFVSVRGLSPVVASGGHSSSQWAGLSLSRPLLLRSTGSRAQAQ